MVTEEAALVSLAEFRRAKSTDDVLTVVPAVIAAYSEGSAALAADYYLDERAAQGVAGSLAVVAVVPDRSVKVERAVLWALKDDTENRLMQVVSSEVAQPYRVTMLSTGLTDPKYWGYQRIARPDGCQLCRMLADRGAVYRHDTAFFAAHTNCDCTAKPWFNGSEMGPEAGTMQYLGSRHNRSAKQNAQLRDYLNAFYPR